MHEQDQQTLPAAGFVEAVRRSRVVDESALEAALAEYNADRPVTAPPIEEVGPDSPATDLARHLMSCKVLTRYQAKELLQGRFRRLRMDHFVIRDLLGVGGMGSVFRAYDEERDMEVALKVLSERFKHDAGMRARFRLEARAGMHLDHPGIVKTYELGVTDDVFGEVDYATMELFEGIALHELVGIMGPLPINASCDIICQAAKALEYIHDQGMIHRDVKPDNVLIDGEGFVRIIDFGLTLINEASENEPAEGEEFSLAMIFGHDCLGTPDYMPPEQALDSRAADVRSDIYSLGCTLFVALTGKRPFYGKTGSEVIRLHKTEPPPDPRFLVEKIPPEIARAVLKMLAKDPRDRFQKLSEVREALHPFSRQRRIEFSFSRLIRNRMALAIKQGRITRRRTSTLIRLSSVDRQSRTNRVLADMGEGSAAALKATDAPRDTAIGRQASPSSRGPRVGHQSTTTAASGAEELLRGLENSSSDAQAAASSAMLKLPGGGLFRLTKADVVIGRSREDADLWIDDKRLTGRHCRLTFDGDQWQAMDLGSRNGTEINGRRINISPLFGNDRLTLGGEVTLVMDWSRRRPRGGLGRLGWAAIAVIVLGILGGVLGFLW